VKGERKDSSVAVVAAACLLFSFPAHAGLFDDDVARQQIVEQQKRTEELRQQSEALTARLAKIEDSLKNQPVFELANQIESLKREINSLRGQIEVLGNNIDGAAKRQRDMYVDLDSRLRRLEQSSTGAPPATPGPSGAAPADAGSTQLSASTPPVDAAESRAYEAAQNQRRIGNYPSAIVAFQGFIAQYPKSPLAPRAQYWIGDSYFNMRDFKNAIASQQKLIKSYPDSSTVADALLNIASSQMELGDTASARRTMDGLVSRYPLSEAAEKAKRRLATLR